MLTFIKHLNIYARQLTKCFMGINSLNSQWKPYEVDIIVPTILQVGEKGKEKLSNLSKVT